MKNFIKNYLLLTLMGAGFVFIFLAFILTAQRVDPAALEKAKAETQQADAPESSVPRATESLIIEKMDGSIVQLNVELARTPEELRKGLMERASMQEDHGMLFVFADEQHRSFWMENTFIPLDIVFIDADGTIHHIHPEAKPHDKTPLRSNGPVKFVLEINGGLAEKLGIEVGDKIIHPAIQGL